MDPLLDPALRGRAIDRALRTLKQDVEAIAGLEYIDSESQTIGGRGRMDTFRYESLYPLMTGFAPTVRLEPGIQSGRQPTEHREIASIVAETLTARGASSELDVTGLESFWMTLMHFRRTFVEKLFAIHGKVERLKQDGMPLGRDVRHYADLYVLAGTPEVTEMLASSEYESIRLDYDEKSRAYFPKGYRPPTGLRFSSSDALFPSTDLQQLIEPGYEEECRRLFFRPHPTFSEVLNRFQEIREVV